jgi:hypothetical protein
MKTRVSTNLVNVVFMSISVIIDKKAKKMSEITPTFFDLGFIIDIFLILFLILLCQRIHH